MSRTTGTHCGVLGLFFLLFIHPSFHPHIHPSIITCMQLSISQPSLHPSAELPVRSPIHPSTHMCITLPTHPHAYLLVHPASYPPIHLSILLFIHPSIHPSIHLSVHPSIHHQPNSPPRGYGACPRLCSRACVGHAGHAEHHGQGCPGLCPAVGQGPGVLAGGRQGTRLI